MPFPGMGQNATTTQPGAGAPPPPGGTAGLPPPGGASAPPPPAAAAAPSLPDCYVAQNGQTSPAPVPGAQLAMMPDDTRVHHEGAWKTLRELKQQFGGQPQQPQQSGWVGGQQQPASQQPASQQPAQQHQQSGWGNSGGGGGGGDPYGGIEQAEVGVARNPYLDEGDYVVHVVSSTFNHGRDHNAQIIEADILVAGPQNPNPALSYGRRVTLYFKVNDSFLSNMKEIVIAASGFDNQGNPRSRDSMVSNEETATMLNGDNPAIVGALLYVEARKVPTRQGGVFTRMNFWPCAANGTDEHGRPVPVLDSIPR